MNFKTTWWTSAWVVGGFAFCGAVWAQRWMKNYPEANLALGAQLIDQHKCSACHAKHVGADGADMYNPKGKTNSPARLLAMVEACNTQLSLSLFPEEVQSIAAVLDQRHYGFSKGQ